MQLLQSVFATANPFLARLFDFWQAGRCLLKSFSYTAEWNPLAANALGAQPTTGITIDPGIDFLLMEINFVAYLKPGATDQAVLSVPNMLLSLQEKSGASIFTDTDHHVALWTGNAQAACTDFEMPFPRLIRGNNAILAKLTDNGGTATHCWLGLEGLRIEYVNAVRQEIFPFLTA